MPALKHLIAEVKPDVEQEITVRQLAQERESPIAERELIVTFKRINNISATGSIYMTVNSTNLLILIGS